MIQVSAIVCFLSASLGDLCGDSYFSHEEAPSTDILSRTIERMPLAGRTSLNRIVFETGGTLQWPDRVWINGLTVSPEEYFSGRLILHGAA